MIGVDVHRGCMIYFMLDIIRPVLLRYWKQQNTGSAPRVPGVAGGSLETIHGYGSPRQWRPFFSPPVREASLGEFPHGVNWFGGIFPAQGCGFNIV